MEAVGDIAIVFASIGAFSFWVTYTFLPPWWRTWTGRHLWTFTTSVTFLLLLGVCRGLVGEPRYWFAIRAFGLWALAVIIIAAEVALVRVQILGRKKRIKEDASK